MSTSEETLFLLPRQVGTVSRPSRIRLIAAFAAVYIIWGSTYQVIEWAVRGSSDTGRSLPPFFLVGVRFLVAGAVLYGIARFNGAARPNKTNWALAVLAGGLLFVAGNGTLSYVEQTVPAGIAALFIATVPLWMVLLNWAWPGGIRPTRSKILGVTIGLLGVSLLGYLSYLKGSQLGGGHILTYSTLLILAAFSWALGSIICTKAELARSPALAAAMTMLMGGALSIAFSIALGTGALGTGGGHEDLANSGPSTGSLIALVYLIVFGSLIAYTSYHWLLKVTTPTRASSFAYVNPVVALFLSWTFDHEKFSPIVIMPTVLIVVAVIMVGGESDLIKKAHHNEN